MTWKIKHVKRNRTIKRLLKINGKHIKKSAKRKRKQKDINRQKAKKTSKQETNKQKIIEAETNTLCVDLRTK